MAEDRLLKIDEAAILLSTTVDWLYHNHAKLPFTVKHSRRQLRFSFNGIQQYIAGKQNGNSKKEEIHARESIQAG